MRWVEQTRSENGEIVNKIQKGRIANKIYKNSSKKLTTCFFSTRSFKERNAL